MIEDAMVMVDGEWMKTRLHEHGEEGGMETGYMEGTKEKLDSLVSAGSKNMEFHCNGVLDTTLCGVVYGPVVCMYDDHYILHLEWESER